MQNEAKVNLGKAKEKIKQIKGSNISNKIQGTLYSLEASIVMTSARFEEAIRFLEYSNNCFKKLPKGDTAEYMMIQNMLMEGICFQEIDKSDVALSIFEEAILLLKKTA